jgi:hypothetical protein
MHNNSKKKKMLQFDKSDDGEDASTRSDVYKKLITSVSGKAFRQKNNTFVIGFLIGFNPIPCPYLHTVHLPDSMHQQGVIVPKNNFLMNTANLSALIYHTLNDSPAFKHTEQHQNGASVNWVGY